MAAVALSLRPHSHSIELGCTDPCSVLGRIGPFPGGTDAAYDCTQQPVLPYGRTRPYADIRTAELHIRAENEVIEEDEEDDSDLYEAPPCDLQSRTVPGMWTPQDNHSQYLALKQARPPPPCKRLVPLPLPDRRMSLPCPSLCSPPPAFTNFPRGMDDLYLTLLETSVKSHSDVAAGREEKSKQRSELSKCQEMGLESKPWYGGEMERREAEWALRRINKDGCFLVRQSSAQNQLHSYTLAVLYHDHIYNIPIRTAGTLGFLLGKEGKRHEEVFPSLVHLIEHYQRELLYLVNRQTSERESTTLLYPALL
ncbi:PREDICTED: SH2 domain-containing protein 6 [Nanorana parkeri]|uniref:SH2 domain-containing protein 6 n=1 Tax=Nanorana parkeri TaxID=125878 RepID=UPI0008546197|nr:PREDICTED: SH2 domain-containing protein 6 [Nanorana parkeri]